MKLAAADIGNSRLKILIDNACYSFEYSKNSIRHIRQVFKVFSNDEIVIAISSVSNKKKDFFLNVIFPLKNITAIAAEKILDGYKKIDFSQISGMGTDRKLGLMAAANYIKPPFFTIDCGTAVTVNFVNQNNICEGGVIFPGVFTQLKSLSKHTEALQNIKTNWEIEQIGKNTDDAISAGIIFSVLGGVKEAIKCFSQKEQIKKLNGIITGGYSHFIYPKLRKEKYKIEYRENL
nr:type III pantothenate kinase [Candidatus Kapabacteria bacterium]